MKTLSISVVKWDIKSKNCNKCHRDLTLTHNRRGGHTRPVVFIVLTVTARNSTHAITDGTVFGQLALRILPAEVHATLLVNIVRPIYKIIVNIKVPYFAVQLHVLPLQRRWVYDAISVWKCDLLTNKSLTAFIARSNSRSLGPILNDRGH